MISELHREFSTYLPSLMLDEVQYQRSNYYYFLSNVSSADKFPIDTQQETNEIRNNILFLDRLLPANVSLGIKKHIWTENVVYDCWDHTIDMKGKPFYVITRHLRVYKCLDNVNGKPSLIEPEDVSLYPITTADGYTWKYMYSVSEYYSRRFTTPNHFPVRRALSETFYDQGSIGSIIIDDQGSGYEDTQLTKIRVSAGGAVLIPQINDFGNIVGVTIHNGGANYTEPPELTVYVPNGGFPIWGGKFGNPSAVLKAVVYQGSIVHVAIHDPGFNYPKLSDTQIVIQGDGYGATAQAIVHDGKVIDAIVTNGGIGYSYIKVSVVGKGTGAKARAVYSQSFTQSDQSDVEQTAVDGAIHSIKIENGGTKYSPTTKIDIYGDGSGATAELVIDDQTGEIVHCKIKEYGSGYTWASVRLSDVGDGINADFYCILPPPGGHGFNAPKELFSDCLIISSSTRDFSHAAISGQEYYQIGMINGLRTLSDNKRAKTSGQFNVIKTKFVSMSNLSLSVVLVYNNGHKFRVANIVGIDEIWLQPLQKNSVDPIGILYDEMDLNKQYDCLEVFEKPIINTHTGDILCLTDEVSFEFSEDQIVTIKTTITI